MNFILWVVAGILAVIFLAAGAVKLTQSKAKLTDLGTGYVEDLSTGTIRTIGALELLAAVGRIPQGRRGETPMIAVNLVLAVFVAWGRLRPTPF